MKWLTIEYIKQHSRIDYDCEDELLELYGEAAGLMYQSSGRHHTGITLVDCPELQRARASKRSESQCRALRHYRHAH